MTKDEFITQVAGKTDMTKSGAKSAIEASLETIKEILKAGDSISFPGFGTFKVSERKARDGRNPRTGEIIKIAACKAPVFSSGKILKTAIN